MDVTIRNLDERVYRTIKAMAAAKGTTVAKVVEAAFRPVRRAKKTGAKKDPDNGWGSFAHLPTFDLGPGNEDLSDRVDEILYGDDPA